MAQKHLQLLRNGSLYDNYAAAYNALIAKTNYADGTPILARYRDGKNNQKTLLGVVNGSGSTVDIINNVSDYLLNGYTAYTESGRPIVISASDDVKTAIAKLDKKVEESSASAATVVTEGTDTGNNMTIDVATDQIDGHKTYTINLTDVASASALSNEIADRKRIEGQSGTAYTKNLSSKYISGATDMNNADVLLSTAIENLAKLSEFEIKEVTENLPAEVKTRYQLVDGQGVKQGEYIDIPKDQTLKSVELTDNDGSGHTGQYMKYTYILSDGRESDVYVNVSRFLVESEFASGVTADTAGVVHGVVDGASEKVVTSYNADGTTAATSDVLSVGADGFKVNNIQTAIDAKVNTLDVSDTANDNQYVSSVSETDGKISVSRQLMVNGKLSGYTDGQDDSPVAETDTLGEAISKLENQVKTAKAAATTVVEEGVENPHLTVTGTTDASTSATTYTITLTDVASENALTEEIAHRKAVDGVNGDAYTADTNAHYINDATTLYSADQELDTAVYELSGKAVTNVAMTGGTAAITANTTDGTKMITINTDGSQLYMTNYASGASGDAVATGDTVNQAIGKLENQIKNAKAASATVVKESESAPSEHLDITADTSAADGHVEYVVTLTDVASETEMHNTFGTGVTTANTATAQFKEVNDKIGTGVTTANTVTSQLATLSGTTADTSGATSVEGAKKYAEAILHTAVDGLDAEKSTYSDTSKQFATYIKQENGQITEFSGRTVSASDVANVSEKAAISAASNVHDALEALADKAAAITIGNADGSIKVTTGASGTDINVNIKAGEKVLAKNGNAGLYTDLDLIKITGDTLPATVKERYQLLATDDSLIGVNIDIAKDSHIVSIKYITTGEHAQNLEYVYIDASGNTQTTYVDMSQLVLENEFASGVTVTDHIAHGVVDSTSESFLTVGANGFKVSGIKDEITAKINALDVTGDTAVTGQYVAAIQEENGIVSVKTRANVSEAVLNNYQKGSDASGVTATDTVNAAISKLENQIDAAKAAATTKVVEGTDAGNNMTIASATSQDDDSVTYTINLTDVASKTALDAEIAARKAVDGQNGDTYAANTSANYISNATSLNDADVKLDAAIKDIADDYMKNIVVNGVTGTTGANNVTTVDIDGGDIKLSGYTQGSDASAPTTADTVNAAISKLYNKSNNISSTNNGITVTTGATATTLTLNVSDYNGAVVGSDSSRYASGDNGNAIQLREDGIFVSANWDCGYYNN